MKTLRTPITITKVIILISPILRYGIKRKIVLTVLNLQ
jgi:hypothetical protein